MTDMNPVRENSTPIFQGALVADVGTELTSAEREVRSRSACDWLGRQSRQAGRKLCATFSGCQMGTFGSATGLFGESAFSSDDGLGAAAPKNAGIAAPKPKRRGMHAKAAI
jgi:hypothetical protein